MDSGWTIPEPDFAVYDHENYRYFAGPALTCSNIYPQMYSRVFLIL